METPMNKYLGVLALLLCSPILMGMNSQSVQNSAQNMVRAEAARQGVPVSLALAVARHESGFKCYLVGKAGERGVMQIKPTTARGIGYRGSASGLSNCATGIRYGMMYLKMAYKKAGGDFYRTAILYNGGLGSKKKRSSYAEKVHKKSYPTEQRRIYRRTVRVHNFGRDNGR
jgi:soluble lytic murein transglycosylase-like protein